MFLILFIPFLFIGIPLVVLAILLLSSNLSTGKAFLIQLFTSYIALVVWLMVTPRVPVSIALVYKDLEVLALPTLFATSVVFLIANKLIRHKTNEPRS